jgi:hypothetical protein
LARKQKSSAPSRSIRHLFPENKAKRGSFRVPAIVNHRNHPSHGGHSPRMARPENALVISNSSNAFGTFRFLSRGKHPCVFQRGAGRAVPPCAATPAAAEKRERIQSTLDSHDVSRG